MRRKVKNKTIVLLGTLDTKGLEVGYLKKEVEKKSYTTIIVDAGILGIPQIAADITRHVVAEAGGGTIEELVDKAGKTSDRMSLIRVMIKGAEGIIKKLYEKGQLDGILSIGGSMGMAIGVGAMKSLPVAVPKLMLATHLYSQYLQETGLTIFQCPTDIMGLNPVTGLALRQAAGAICGMVGEGISREKVRLLIAMTGLGVTTQGIVTLQALLRGMEYDTVVFHGNSIYMDELVEDGVVDGIIDFSPNELIRIFILNEAPERKGRLEAAGRKGLPQVIVPGGLDMIIFRKAKDEIPQNYRNRKTYLHGPYITGVRTTKDELRLIANIVVEKCSHAQGPVAMVFPLRGFSAIDREGKSFHEPDTDRAFLETIEQMSRGRIEIHKVDAHILDDSFVREVARVYTDISGRGEVR